MENTEMDVQEAVRIAVEHFRSMGDLLTTKDLRLEETSIDPTGNWLITLSTTEPAFPVVMEKRNYKTIEVDAKSKKVLAMKMRNPFAIAS